MRLAALVALLLLPPLNGSSFYPQSKPQAASHDSRPTEPKQAAQPGAAHKEGGEQNSAPHQTTAEEKGTVPSKPRFDYVFGAFWVNLALAVATFVLAIYAVKQANASRDAAEAARENAIAAKANAEAVAAQTDVLRDTAQRQLRAYVLVDSALLKFPTPNMPRIQVHFKNFGQTPAYDFHGWIGIYIGDFPLRTNLPSALQTLRKGREPLAPGRKSIHVTEPLSPVAAEHVPLLGTVQGTVWVYGEMTYRDAFGAERYLRNRLMHGGSTGVQPVKNTDGMILGYLMKADSNGNEAN